MEEQVSILTQLLTPLALQEHLIQHAEALHLTTTDNPQASRDLALLLMCL